MTTLDPSPTPASPEPEPEGPHGLTLGRVAAIVISLGIALMWVYVFVTAGSYRPPGWLEDRTFPKAAERVCASYTPRFEEIPLANTARTSTERADLVDEATALLADRRDELETIVPDTDDARFIRAWLADWKVHLADREDYSRRLRGNPAAEFRETAKETSQISKVLDKFAKDNRMASCETLDDV